MTASRSPIRSLFAAASLGVLLLAGCGGSSDADDPVQGTTTGSIGESTTSESTTSKATTTSKSTADVPLSPVPSGPGQVTARLTSTEGPVPKLGCELLEFADGKRYAFSFGLLGGSTFNTVFFSDGSGGNRTVAITQGSDRIADQDDSVIVTVDEAFGPEVVPEGAPQCGGVADGYLNLSDARKAG